MGILTRMLRLFKADMHGVMDELEDQGLLLKQHLREMEDYLTQREAALQNLQSAQQKTQTELARVTEKCTMLERDLTVALNKSRDDIARPLIRQLQSLRRFEARLKLHLDTTAEDIAHAREELDRRRGQYAQIQLEAHAYLQSAPQPDAEGWTAFTGRVWESMEPTQEEIEIELLQRKEALKGGV
jgi:phage shock protein A